MTELESAAPHRVAMTTRLSKAECMARLKGGVGHYLNMFTSKPVRGVVLPQRVLLMTSRWFSSHTPVMLTLTEDGAGTRIEGQAGMHIASIATVGILVGLSLIGALVGLAVGAPWFVLAAPLILIGACAFAMTWIALTTRRSHTEILAYVRRLLEAQEADPPLVR